MSNSNSLVCVWSQLAQSSGRSQAAVVVSPPLKGARWIVGGGCCTPYNYHRGATLPINGTIHVAERYAVDFVQLNDNNMLYSGPQDQLSSYAFFGTEIHSVADGISPP
jgi:hypothetical protein